MAARLTSTKPMTGEHGHLRADDPAPATDPSPMYHGHPRLKCLPNRGWGSGRHQHLDPLLRGNDSVDIDHVVALSNALQTGAPAWDIRKRGAVANDPVNSLAVDPGTNRH